MITFKEFITETISEDMERPALSFTMAIDLDFIKDKEIYANEVEQLIYKKTNNRCHITISKNEFSIFMYIDNSEQGTNLYKEGNKIAEIISNHVYGEGEELCPTYNTFVIIRKEIPENLHIDFIYVSIMPLNSSVGNISLHNIHKQLKCEKLSIYNGEKITKCALGLLQIPGLNLIHNASNNNKWVNILIDAFEKNKDILDVKEELINTGYKDLAKL